jgi:hypothetical protein
MSPRTGRPIKGESKKSGRFELRLNDEENALLEELSNKLHLTKAEVILLAIKKLSDEQ